MARRRYLDDDTYGIMTYGNPIRTTTGGIPRIVAGFNPDGTVRTAISRTSDQEDAELYGPEVTITPASGVFTESFNGRTDYPSAAAYYQSLEGEPGLENPDIDPLTLGLGFGRTAANGALKTVPKVLERGLHYMNPSAYTGAGAYSTPMGGTGTNLLGAALDNALFSGMAATAFNEFANNPSLYTGVNAGLNALPFAAAGLPFLAKKARSANEIISNLDRVSNTADDVALQNAARQNAARISALKESGLSTEEAANQVYREIVGLNESPTPRNLYLDTNEVDGVDDDYFRLYDAAIDNANSELENERYFALLDDLNYQRNDGDIDDIDGISSLLNDTPFEAQASSEQVEQRVSDTSFRNRSLDEQNRLYDKFREIRLIGGTRDERINRVTQFVNDNNLDTSDIDELDNLITSGTRPTPITNSDKITLSINGSKNPETDRVIKDYTDYLLDKINGAKSKEEINDLIKRHLQYRNKFVDDNNLNIKDLTTKNILESIETKLSRQLKFEDDVYVVQNNREYNINGKKYIGEYGKLKDSNGNVLSEKESKALLKKGGYKREPNRWDYAGSGGILYGGNSMRYSRTPDGHIDITEANFFNPEGEPNILMDFANKQLTTGDVISIANKDDALSSDSNPLLGLSLIRDLQNSIERVASDGSIIPATTKGYVIEPKGESVKLNGFGQKKYRGLLFNMTRDEKEEKLEKIKGIYKQLEELNNQRNPDHPIHFDDKDFYFDGYNLYVPGYKARHLKYGGLVRGRNNKRTMACYGRKY